MVIYQPHDAILCLIQVNLPKVATLGFKAVVARLSHTPIHAHTHVGARACVHRPVHDNLLLLVHARVRASVRVCLGICVRALCVWGGAGGMGYPLPDAMAGMVGGTWW